MFSPLQGLNRQFSNGLAGSDILDLQNIGRRLNALHALKIALHEYFPQLNGRAVHKTATYPAFLPAISNWYCQTLDVLPISFLPFFFFLRNLIVTILFIYGCTGSLLQYAGFSYCGAWALGLQTSVVVVPGLIAPWHVESSQSRDQTHVLCIGRQILNHWTTGEVCQSHF